MKMITYFSKDFSIIVIHAIANSIHCCNVHNKHFPILDNVNTNLVQATVI